MAMLDDFIARFPHLGCSKINALFPVLEPTLCSYYGGSYTNDKDKNALLLLMAHLIVTDPSYTGSNAPSKSQASKSVGSVSVSYVAGSTGTDLNSWLNSTAYGQQYLIAISSNIGPMFA